MSIEKEKSNYKQLFMDYCKDKIKNLSNENYRKWNSSAYTYNPSKRRFEFDKNLGRSADVPKYINDRR